MRLTKNDIPYLMDFVGYKGPQEPCKIQEWLNLYNNDNPFSMFHIYITQHCEQEPIETWVGGIGIDGNTINLRKEIKIKSTPTGYYWYRICAKYNDNNGYFEPCTMISGDGQPGGYCFPSYEEAETAAIIRCLMAIVCKKDIYCYSSGHYIVDAINKNVYDDNGYEGNGIRLADNTTLEEFFKIIGNL